MALSSIFPPRSALGSVLALCVGWTLGVCSAADAQTAPAPTAPAPTVPSERAEEPAKVPYKERASESAKAGMFLPWSMAPRTDSQRAFLKAAGGYDSVRRGALFDSTMDVTLWGPIALRVGVDYGERKDSDARPSGGLRVQALKQERHAIDMSIGVFYRPEGFTEPEGEIEGVIAFGRRIERWLLIANLVYGQDPEGHERDAEVRLGTLYEAISRVLIGIDTRARFDLGTEEEKLEEEGGAKYDLVLGPTLNYSPGWVSIIANAGFRGVGYEGAGFEAGFIGLLGLAGSI